MKPAPRMMLAALGASLSALLLLAGPAVTAPGPDPSPVRFWSVSKVEQAPPAVKKSPPAEAA